MSSTIKTRNWGNIELITTDSYTGEGTDDLRLEIDSKYCSAWIYLTDDEVRILRDELNEWLDE
jgi:hypothetical protein